MIYIDSLILGLSRFSLNSISYKSFLKKYMTIKEANSILIAKTSCAIWCFIVFLTQSIGRELNVKRNPKGKNIEEIIVSNLVVLEVE